MRPARRRLFELGRPNTLKKAGKKPTCRNKHSANGGTRTEATISPNWGEAEIHSVPAQDGKNGDLVRETKEWRPEGLSTTPDGFEHPTFPRGKKAGLIQVRLKPGRGGEGKVKEGVKPNCKKPNVKAERRADLKGSSLQQRRAGLNRIQRLMGLVETR